MLRYDYKCLGEKTAVICEKVLPNDFVEFLKEKALTLINVSKENVFCINLLSIGKKVIISHNQAEDVNDKLKQLGFKIIQLDLKEVLKSGWGPQSQCISFPLLRE